MISAAKTLKKFKNIESPNMVSKRLYGHYLRSYEQIKKSRILISIWDNYTKILHIKLVFELIIVIWVIFLWLFFLLGGGEGANPSPKNSTGSSVRAVLMDGWMESFFFFFIFILISDNKHDILIPKMCFKVAYAF